MKQRFILKIDTGNNRKYIGKVMSIIGEYRPGYMSEVVPFNGGIDHDKYMFAGEDIDIIDLCNLLRKKVGPTDIMSITPDGFMPPPNLPPPLGSNPPPSSASSSNSSAAAYHYGQQQQQQPPVMYGGHPNNPYYPPPHHHQETCTIM